MINIPSKIQMGETGNPGSSIYSVHSTLSIVLRTLFIFSILFLIGGNNTWAQTTSYVLNNSNETSWGTVGESGNYNFSEPGKTLTFEAKRTGILGVSNTKNFYAQYSTDGGSTWTNVLTINLSSKDTWYPQTCEIPENANCVRMVTETGATGNKQIRNVKITRATTLSTSTSSIDFGTQHINTSSTNTANINFNNTTYNQTVSGTCTDNHFTVTSKEVGETGSTTVEITYASVTPGIHSGTVTLNMNGKSVSFPVSGSSEATYNFSALAEPNNATFGSASASVTQSITSTNASESPVATFTATANDGYEFVGWGTTANATTYESTENPYSPTITNSAPGTIATKELYAIFCPVFNFSVNAEKIYDYGTVYASVNEKILGTPSDKSISTQATFTATPNNECTFEGWYLDREHTQLASTDATYTPSMTNSIPGSTESLTLYAWFKSNQTLNWKNVITDFNLVQGTTADCAATASSGLNATYTSSNSIVASVDENGLVTGNIVSNDGVLITASQAGNDQYNAAPEITRTFYVLEKLQASFVVTGFSGNNPTLKVEDQPFITVSNTDGDFTFSSSNTDVLSLEMNNNVITLTALKAGSATVTLSQAANDTHNASSAVYNITVERHQGGLSISLPETMKVGDSTTDFWNTGNNEVSVNVESNAPSVITYADGTLTAVGEGTATITVSQAESNKWAGESRQQTITVSKVANTLGISLPAQETQVDGTIAVTFSNMNNTGTPVICNITEQTLSSSVSNGTDVITYENGILTARNAGTAKVSFSQAASDKYESYSGPTIEITVTKVSNPISVSLAGSNATTIRLKYAESASLEYSSANNDTPCNVIRTGGSYTTISGNTITAGSTAGTDTYEIKQEETYKYEAGYASFSVRVNNTDEELGYVLYDENEYSHGAGAGVAHTYELSGPGEILYYSASKGSNMTIYYNLYVEYSTDNATWSEAQNNESLSSSYKDFSCAIPETARFVRFRFPGGGTLTKYIKNVKVPRKTYVRASSDKTDFGTVYTGSTAQATFTVDYSTTNGGNIHLNSSNTNFSFSTEELAATANSDGTKTFTVTYTPNPAQLGQESSIITISDLFYTQQITLTATSAKRENTLEVIGEQDMKVGDAVDNVYTDKNSDAELSVSMSNEGVVSYDATANRLTAIGEGTAAVTFSQNATDLYLAVTKTVTVTVSKNSNTLVMSLDKPDLKVEETANVNFTDKNSDGAITASFSVDGIVSYHDGTITALKAGNTRITLSQASTVAHVATSQSFDITVSKHEQTILWDNTLSGNELNLNIGQELSTNTATASSGLSVTYSSSNPAVLSVDATTGKLTALSDGANIMITATQAGNEKYKEASVSRSFSVVSKMNAVVITSLSTTGTNELTIGKNSASISCSALLSENNFSIIGDNNIVSTSFANNTLTITPVRSGDIKLTLFRAEDDSYHAIDQTYHITVLGAIAVLSPEDTPSLEYTDYSEITLLRTFKAGYSTLSLPFRTNVGELVGELYDADNDWLAQLSVVTYNAQDGYTLYFNKVTDGIIQPNMPYILHLADGVNQPVFTNVTAESPIPGEHIATGGIDNAGTSFTQWKMVANYTPEMSMEGYYGITGNRIMLGGSTSTLNAYTAYIVPPAEASARVRVAVTDENGNTTYIDSNESSDNSAASVYTLNGIRSSRIQPGINIVIDNNGMARKIIR